MNIQVLSVALELAGNPAIHIDICIYVFTCDHIYIYMYMHMYIYVFIHICIYICIHIYIHIYAYTYGNVYIYTYIYICIYIYIYMYIHIFIFIYTHISTGVSSGARTGRQASGANNLRHDGSPRRMFCICRYLRHWCEVLSYMSLWFRYIWVRDPVLQE